MLPISADTVIDLAGLGMTISSIAALLGIDRKVIERRFRKEYNHGKAHHELELLKALKEARKDDTRVLVTMGMKHIDLWRNPDTDDPEKQPLPWNPQVNPDMPDPDAATTGANTGENAPQSAPETPQGGEDA